jgi:hypothetical protein
LLRHDSLAGTAFYLETPDMEQGYDAVNMARVHDLVAGRPLTPGPVAQEAAPAAPAAAPEAAQDAVQARSTGAAETGS